MVIGEGWQAVSLLFQVVVSVTSAGFEHFSYILYLTVEVQDGVAQIKEYGFYWTRMVHCLKSRLCVME